MHRLIGHVHKQFLPIHAAQFLIHYLNKDGIENWNAQFFNDCCFVNLRFLLSVCTLYVYLTVRPSVRMALALNLLFVEDEKNQLCDSKNGADFFQFSK